MSVRAPHNPQSLPHLTPDNIPIGRSVHRKDAGVLTIGDVQGWTSEELPVLLEEYGPLVDFCRQNRVIAPLKNNTYIHALGLTQTLYDRTDSEYRMLTGGCGFGLITKLRDSFVAMLRRLREAKALRPSAGHARIVVVDAPHDNTTIDELVRDFGDVLSVKRATANGEWVKHYIVGDEDMVRDEQVHPPLTLESPVDTVKADVYFYNPDLARAFSRRFDHVWSQLT